MAIHLGRIKRPLMESELKAAQSISKSEHEVSRRLGVSFATYKKYALLYGIYGNVINPSGKGTDKSIKNEDSGKYPLSRVLKNEFPNYSTNRLRHRLIRSNRYPQKCNKCDFSEKRVVDNRVPLVLNYKDGNSKNKMEENVELICYNCYFLNVNNPFGKKKKFKLENDEKIEIKESI